MFLLNRLYDSVQFDKWANKETVTDNFDLAKFDRFYWIGLLSHEEKEQLVGYLSHWGTETDSPFSALIEMISSRATTPRASQFAAFPRWTGKEALLEISAELAQYEFDNLAKFGFVPLLNDLAVGPILTRGAAQNFLEAIELSSGPERWSSNLKDWLANPEIVAIPDPFDV